MRINNTLGGFSSPHTIQHFHEACLVGITHGRFAIWLDPFGMLDPEIIVNLSAEFRVAPDLMMHGGRLGAGFICSPGRFAYLA